MADNNQRALPAGLVRVFTTLNTELYRESVNLGSWDEYVMNMWWVPLTAELLSSPPFFLANRTINASQPPVRNPVFLAARSS